MKRIHDINRIAELFIKAGLVAAIAGAVLLPLSINAHGGDATSHHKPAMSASRPGATDALPLPPIVRIDTIPWLTFERSQKTRRIDTLLAPGNPHNVFAGNGGSTQMQLSSGVTFMAPNTPENG